MVTKENVREGRQTFLLIPCCRVCSLSRKVYTFPYKSQAKISQPKSYSLPPNQGHKKDGAGRKGGCIFQRLLLLTKKIKYIFHKF